MAAMNVASRAGLAQNALWGRVALVTGAASGIGWATTRLLIDLGVAVVALDRDAAALSARCDAAPDVDGRRLHQVVFDLADLGGIDALVERVTAERGQVTILVNAAGIIGKTILTTSLEEWEQVLAIDLTAPFLLTKAVGRRMAEHGHGGSIVNVGSSSAHRAVSSGAAYGAAKAGLGSLTPNGSGKAGHPAGPRARSRRQRRRAALRPGRRRSDLGAAGFR